MNEVQLIIKVVTLSLLIADLLMIVKMIRRKKDGISNLRNQR